jgi:hypothetical protein
LVAAFPGKDLDYQDHYILNLGTYNSCPIAHVLMSRSSKTVLSFMKEYGDQWITETAIQKAIPMHITFAHSFGMNLNDLHHFYSYMISNALDMAESQKNNTDWKTGFIAELEENFQLHKDSLIAYVEYLWESLTTGEIPDEEWISSWKTVCDLGNKELGQLQEAERLIVPENFVPNPSIGVTAQMQERWLLLEQYTIFMNGQFGLGLMSVFSLLYAIKESTGNILQGQEA